MNELKQMVLDVMDEFDAEYECIEIKPDYADPKVYCEKYSFPMEISCIYVIIIGVNIKYFLSPQL